jgi:hypothetical protein
MLLYCPSFEMVCHLKTPFQSFVLISLAINLVYVDRSCSFQVSIKRMLDDCVLMELTSNTWMWCDVMWCSCCWLQHQQEFTNDMEVIGQAVRGLASGGAFTCCDLSELFQIAAAEAHSSHALDRTLRVVFFSFSSCILHNSSPQLFQMVVQHSPIMKLRPIYTRNNTW